MFLVLIISDTIKIVAQLVTASTQSQAYAAGLSPHPDNDVFLANRLGISRRLLGDRKYQFKTVKYWSKYPGKPLTLHEKCLF